MKIFFTITAFFSLVFTLNAQTENWQQKIDDRLLERVFGGKKAEFLVILTDQADVSYADHLRRKEDKGRYVYETLSKMAEKTQGPVKAAIEKASAPWLSFWIVNALWSNGSLDLIEQLAQMPEVLRVEDNPVVHLDLMPRDATDVVDDRTLTPVSWGLTKINADDVWALGPTGAGVVVGGQDTGYEWEHPALKEKYRGWGGSTADHNYNWHDAIHSLIGGGSNSCGLNLRHPCDDNGHGTHTMGTMTGSSSESNVVGVAPSAKWIGCRNMEEGDGTPATYIECFQWFIAPTDTLNGNPDPSKAPHVINNSWSCPGSEGCNSGNYYTMDTVIQHVRSAGILVVVSAGNSGPSCSTVNAPPAIYSSSFVVGATTNVAGDDIASFSSRGPVNVYTSIKKPDIAAPGYQIYSCTGTDNNSGAFSYSTLSGTSMAGPHIAGVAALIMSARSDLKGQVATLESIMKNTSVPRYPTATQLCGGETTSSYPNNVYGYGRADALAAVNYAIALPVELVDFQVIKQGKYASLYWETASESDCLSYEIERSSDGARWQKIGEKGCKGAGLYHFSDAEPGSGLVYYRLKQLDLSGTFAYSKIVHVAFSASGYGISVYTDFRNQTIRVQAPDVDAAEGPFRIFLLSADGRTVYEAEFLHQVISMRDYPSGVYAVVLKDARGMILGSGKTYHGGITD